MATRVLALLLSLSILTLARGGEAQEAGQGQVTITGTVVNAVTGQPLPGVLVVIGGAGVRLESDPAGRFTLARIPVGTYTLELSRAGYHPSVDDFTVMRAGEFVTAGVHVLPDAGNPLEKYIMLSGGRSEGCFPRVVLDGMMVQGGGSEPARIDRLLTPGVVAGVEVYPRSAGVPIQYSGTGSSCGVVIIWTRRGVR